MALLLTLLPLVWPQWGSGGPHDRLTLGMRVQSDSSTMRQHGSTTVLQVGCTHARPLDAGAGADVRADRVGHHEPEARQTRQTRQMRQTRQV